jgi:hypothetical protein
VPQLGCVVEVAGRTNGIHGRNRAWLFAARRVLIIAISGTIPEPPATSRTGPGSAGRQTNHPPTGPRISSGLPAEKTPVR